MPAGVSFDLSSSPARIYTRKSIYAERPSQAATAAADGALSRLSAPKYEAGDMHVA